MFSVALDEAHEMEINLKSKNALNSFSQSSLATLTYYLLLKNLKLLKENILNNFAYPLHHTVCNVSNCLLSVCLNSCKNMMQVFVTFTIK
jgi:hypothetical protein